ncbi:DUF2971 domain-containing protein [Vreelandella aquamarina]|uniref:DUF2971 domain-containing protein n=1 Tax=Vreelandella aquamarina TaxID=77097 RepID=A0A857GLJ0_9GAMM|nr:DUF2971 domain-containing protein [Halomonas meridiana]QHD50143.1 hypothetical protein CTT34_10790 [Halomonas meridiana]
MSQTHDKHHFYKYMSVETALKVIANQSLRWSSPLKFNDPFDHQIGFTFEFGGQEIGQAVYHEMERIVFGGKSEFQEPSLFTEVALRLQGIADRLPKDAIMEDFAEAAQEIADNFPYHVARLHDEIQEQLTHSRVLCISERNDNVVMWSHYAEEHRGVVLKLRCIDKLDNTLLAARRVDYSRQFPKFPSLGQYVRHLTGEKPLNLAALTWDMAFTKHSDWAYEKEWRVHMPLLNEPPGDGYTLINEHPSVFGAVYLGCRMTDEDRGRILEAVEKHIPHAQAFQAKRSDASFDIAFEEV